MGLSRRNRMFLGTISMLSFVAIGILYVDIGLRGSFDTISNLRVFFDQQVLHFTFSSSLFDVVVLTFLRMLLLGLQSLLVKKFNTTLVLVQSSLALVYMATKGVVIVSAGGADHLQWAILFIASGYALLELLMALLGRFKELNGPSRRETAPILEIFSVKSTLPPERLASEGSKFMQYCGVLFHYKFAPAPAVVASATAAAAAAVTTTTTTTTTTTSATTTTTTAAPDRPLIVIIHGTGGCADTFSEIVVQLAQRTGLNVCAIDRPGWGLTERNPRMLTSASSTVKRNTRSTATMLNVSSPNVSVANDVNNQSESSQKYSFDAGGSIGLLPTIELVQSTASLNIPTSDNFQDFKHNSTGTIKTAAAAGGRSPYGSVSRVMMDVGGGQVPAREVRYGDAFAADAVAALAVVLGSRRIVLLAHGDGARVALRVLLRHPRLVAASVLLSPCIYSPELPWNQQALISRFPKLASRIYSNLIEQKILMGNEYFYDPKRVMNEQVRRAYRSTLRVNGFEDALETFARVRGDGTDRELLRLICESTFASIPMMLLHGENDKIVPLAHSIQLASDLDVVKFQTLRSCGHAPHLERPIAFLSSIGEFLNELELSIIKPSTTQSSSSSSSSTTMSTTTSPSIAITMPLQNFSASSMPKNLPILKL